MDDSRRIGVDVAETHLLPASAATPTARCRWPIADNVGVLDVSSGSLSAETSTLSTATASGEGSTGGVGVTACLLPSTSALTPTPTVASLAEKTPMRGGGVGVPETSCTSAFARTSTWLTTLVPGTMMTGVAEVPFAPSFAATPVTSLMREGRRTTMGGGVERGSRGGDSGGTQVTVLRALSPHHQPPLTLIRQSWFSVSSFDHTRTTGTTRRCPTFAPPSSRALEPMAMARRTLSHILSRRLPPASAGGASAERPGGMRSLATGTGEPTGREGSMQHIFAQSSGTLPRPCHINPRTTSPRHARTTPTMLPMHCIPTFSSRQMHGAAGGKR